MTADYAVIVELCMGSACFALGNKMMVEFLTEFIAVNGLSGKVRIKGALCEGLCSKGPVVKINGTLHYNTSAAELSEIILQQTEVV